MCEEALAGFLRYACDQGDWLLYLFLTVLVLLCIYLCFCFSEVDSN